MTDSLLAAGKDKFIVSMPDWHPGGDCIAAFRDPMNLAFDMHDNREAVKALLPRISADYFRLYDLFYHKLRQAGQPISTWLSLVSDGTYYVPSNDFSIMISTEMFEEIFVPGLAEECRFLDRSIYHLDGPGALRHLDTILAIPDLDALQFVPGAGNEGSFRFDDHGDDTYLELCLTGHDFPVCASEGESGIDRRLHELLIDLASEDFAESHRAVGWTCLLYTSDAADE